MNILLYNIPGINAIDTPVFSNIDMQNNYFSNTCVATISSGFYPPFYRNKITLNISDAPLLGEYNYLSLVYEENELSKTFYYFIDRYEYVNEGVIDLYITMDVIQTYMFDIEFVNSLVTRRSIKRWEGTTIKRDYLRENLSEGVFKEASIKGYSNCSDFSNSPVSSAERITGTVVIKSAPSNSGECTTVLYGNGLYTKELQSSFSYNLYFMSKGSIITGNFTAHDTSTNTDTWANINYPSYFSKYITDSAYSSKVKLVYFVPFVVVSDVSYISKLNYAGNKYETASSIEYALWIKANNSSSVSILQYSDNMVFGFEPPSTICPDFDPKYCPVLLDSFYIHFTFGEPDTLSEFPLFKLTADSIDCHYMGDVFTGQRMYWITGTTDITEDFGLGYNMGPVDPYGTLRITRNLLTFDIVTSAYQEWYTYNKATQGLNMVSGIFGVAGGIL